jgi:uncharacterized SAM-binding protein YcdF (DUF218 family)
MSKPDYSTDELAEILWNYHLLHHKLEKSDAILVLGNHDIRSADYSVELFKQGWAPIMIFTGGAIHQNPKLEVHWELPEAEIFAQRAVELGVPENAILTESRSKNTGENFELTARLLGERGIEAKSFIVVQKPYMERRTLATGLKHWPNAHLIVTSPPTTFEEYVSGDVPKNQVISFMVGDLQRIKVYPEKGLQVPQEIPDQVWHAYLHLVERGFTDRLIRE